MTLFLDPEHGEALHILRPCINRPDPKIGEQVVWRVACGRIIHGRVKCYLAGGKRPCKRCVPGGAT